MTSKLTITNERLAELVAFKPLPGTDINSATRDEWMAMAAELQERRKAAMDSEPVAYMTYKGYLLHAGDPKLAEYSEPMPLYADPRLEPESAEPVAWTWHHLKQWHVTNDEERARDLAWDGVKVEPLYRHAQPAPVVPDEMTAEQAYEIGDYHGDPVDVFARGANWMRQHIIDSISAATPQEVKP